MEEQKKGEPAACGLDYCSFKAEAGKLRLARSRNLRDYTALSMTFIIVALLSFFSSYLLWLIMRPIHKGPV